MKSIHAFLVLLALTVTGCVSDQQHAAERTARLRDMYPAGMSREEVRAKWGGTKPDFSASRAANGWESEPNQYLANKLKAVEARTGKKVEYVERYWGADGWMSLCNCWYFYDSGNKLIDAEWQYKSD